MLAMNLHQTNPQVSSPQPPAAPPAPPGLFAANSFGSASSPPTAGNVHLQLQQAAPLSSSFSFPSPRQGGEKRGRCGRLSNGCAPPMMPLPPPIQDDSTTAPQHESSSKKRRSSQYVAPRTVPATFTSVTAPGTAMRRNLSFSRIDPYVSYAQTPSLAGGTADMDMDASSGNQYPSSSADPSNQSRVRSMSF